jgi:F-type H+-transporting ATPase subunit epsilon
MSQMHLKIVTPEEVIFDDEVDMVSASTPDGEIGILPHHANLMTKITPGELRIKDGNKTQVLATGGGLLQIIDNTVSIITDMAEEASDIDLKAAQEAHDRAQTALKDKSLSAEEHATVVAMLEKSLAQLRVKRRHHTKIS